MVYQFSNKKSIIKRNLIPVYRRFPNGKLSKDREDLK
jgi:hypothetical protein